MICPKCNSELIKEIFRNNYIYRCKNCNRGYMEWMLKSLDEEKNMTLHLIDNLYGEK
jgi:transposase-like protein